MSRMSSGADQIVVKPTSNVYTVLAVVAIVADIVALIVMWQQSMLLSGKPLFPGT